MSSFSLSPVYESPGGSGPRLLFSAEGIDSEDSGDDMPLFESQSGLMSPETMKRKQIITHEARPFLFPQDEENQGDAVNFHMTPSPGSERKHRLQPSSSEVFDGFQDIRDRGEGLTPQGQGTAAVAAGLEGRKMEIEPLFNNPLPMLRRVPPVRAIESVNSAGFYRARSGSNNMIIQQPPGSRICGQAALVMAFQTLAQKDQVSMKHKRAWIDEYRNTDLSNEIQVRNLARNSNLEERGLSVKSSHLNEQFYLQRTGNKNNKDAHLEVLMEVIERTKRPVLLSITHPKVGGHWIVVDAVKKRCCCGSKPIFDVRDSHAGLAHRVSYNELRKSIDLEGTKIVYFEPAQQQPSCVIL